MRLITLAQASRLLKCQGDFPDHLIQGYCTDSRLVKPGELFFALKGERVDGHHFLHEARLRGAIAAVVSKEYRGPEDCLLFVDDPLHALQELAHLLLLHRPVRIVAITGSVGKTSTKEFTKTLLLTKYRAAASPGNSNSQVGVPLTILNHTTGDEEVLILEMGMTESGQLTRLIQIAPPEVAVITTVALVHACYFESIDEIALAKGEILSHPRTLLGVIDRNIPKFTEIYHASPCPKLSFSSASSQADFTWDPLNPYQVQAQGERQTISLDHLPGKHNLHNLLAAMIVARYFNIEWEEIRRAAASLTLPDKRLQFIRHKDILFLNDSYNAAEISVKAALETLPNPENGGTKVAVLGSMMELGKFSSDCHQRVGEFALKHVERLYCLGEECLLMYEHWLKVGRPVKLFEKRSDLVACLKKELRAHDVVLLKGSRSKELWKILEEL